MRDSDGVLHVLVLFEAQLGEPFLNILVFPFSSYPFFAQAGTRILQKWHFRPSNRHLSTQTGT